MDAVKSYDPRINVKREEEKSHVVMLGGSQITQTVTTANSYQLTPNNPSQAMFNYNAPSANNIIDRNFKVRAYVEVVCDAAHQLGTNDAVRQFPLNSIIETCSATINGSNVSNNTANSVAALMCYGNGPADRDAQLSTTAAMPDSYQEYNDWTTYGSGKNPLADYGENAAEPPRGGFPVEVVNSTTFRVVVTEPLLGLAPFFSGIGPQEEGFCNINDITVTLQFKAQLDRFLSHSTAGNAITAVTAKFYQAPELLVTAITTRPQFDIPPVQNLYYHKTNDYIKTLPTLASGASTTIYSDNQKLTQIPRRVYLFCKHSRSTESFLTSDSFLSIENLQVNWNNQTALLGSATKQDLFEMSRRNGCNLSWSAWSKYRGSVLCLNFGKDIGLSEDESSGVSGDYALSVQMTVKNQSTQPFTADFVMLVEQQGIFRIMPNSAAAYLGGLTKDNVADIIENSPEISHSDLMDMSGGSFWSSLKNVVNKVAHGVSKALPFVSKVVGAVAPEFSGVVDTVGQVANGAAKFTGGRLANPAALMYQQQEGGRLAGGAMSGGRLAGGRMRRRR